MTSNELRIGNIVRLRDCGEIVTVCAITKRKIGFHAPNERKNAHLRYRRLDEIEGVPIFDHWEKIKCPNLTWCGYEDGDEKYLYYYVPWPHRKSRHIHELQNIHYALTGEEIKIEI